MKKVCFRDTCVEQIQGANFLKPSCCEKLGKGACSTMLERIIEHANVELLETRGTLQDVFDCLVRQL